MQPLATQRIVVAISGGIAAYKSAELVRLLVQAQAEVRVVMTQAACEFITPLTLQALSGHPVHLHRLDQDTEAGMGHIELARWAQRVVVAPATAHTLARLAHGLADDLLTTLCLATTAPLAVAPAMNRVMWDNPATQANMAQLRARNIQIIGPEAGQQACGEQGLGRMTEPAAIVQQLAEIQPPGCLSGLKLLINAGPTWEAIDPVRFIANRSSGKMGYAIAQAAYQWGAEVTLVSGPVCLPAPVGVRVQLVESATDMLELILAHSTLVDVFIAAAAVADYRVQQPALQKIKNQPVLHLSLEKNPDILATVAALPNPPFLLGFAAETQNMEQYALEKLQRKRVDMIAANRVGKNLGFGEDSHALTLYWLGGSHELARAPKLQLAYALLAQMKDRFDAKNSG